MGGLDDLAQVPRHLDELRRLLETLIDDYEGLNQRQELISHLLYHLSGTSGDKKVHQLRGQLRTMMGSESDEGS